MTHTPGYHLLPGGPEAFGRAVEVLAAYRPSAAFDRAERLRRWLGNFALPSEQYAALRAVADLEVVDPEAAVPSLLAQIQACVRDRAAAEGWAADGSLLHAADETSGMPLLRILEKRGLARAYQILGGDDLAALEAGGATPYRARRGVAVRWDSVYGSGGQHERAIPRLARLLPGRAVWAAYLIADPDGDLPEGAFAYARRRCDPALLELDDRYAPLAEPDAARRARLLGYRRPMLATPPDNAPNNLPLILWAKGREGRPGPDGRPGDPGWATLLDRDETPRP